MEAKLRPPRPSGRLIPRPALGRLLDRLDDRILTVVAAPTGYGKTTMLAAWARSRPNTAWVSLDEDDDEPIRFARTLVAAVRRLLPDFGRRAEELLDSPVADVLGDVRAMIVDELEHLDDRLTIILDDLHLIRSPTCRAMIAALVVDDPRGLRLVISTRSDPPLPLGRLRASGRLGEIRVAELRFVPAEAGVLLSESFGLDVAPDAIELLTARTEGWPAGLYLAGLSAQATRDASAFITGFSGSDRNVAEYLAEEVLAALPPEMREFLVATSVVDTLTGDLCDALTGTTGGAARLEELVRSNAFVVRLDGKDAWYRYHRLFREALLAELAASGSGAIAARLSRAADWYEAQGLTEAAARSALAAGDIERAGSILASAARDLMRMGELATLRLLLARLDRGRLGRARSAVEVTEALAAGLAGEPRDVIEAYLAAAEASGPLVTHPFGLPDSTAARLFTDAAYLTDDVGRQALAGTTLVERYPGHPLLPWLGRAALVSATWFGGEVERARRATDAFGSEVRPEILLLSIVAVSVRSLIACEDGDLDLAETLARRAHAAVVAGRLSDAHAAGLAHAALGAVLAARGALPDAVAELERSLELRGRNAGVHRADALLSLGSVRTAMGDGTAARAHITEARTIIERCADPGALPARLAQAEAMVEPRRRRAEQEAERPSDAQLRVLRLLATDLSRREIARELYLSDETVKSHTRALYRLLGVTTRHEAVARARARSYL